MGADTVLLVNRRAALGLIAGAFLAPGSAKAEPVVAADYDSFWLWAGVTSQPVLASARSLYFLQGEVVRPRRPGADIRLIAQAGATPHAHPGQIWLTYRVSTLDWPLAVYDQILARLERWRAAGQPVTGLQIDFDSGTRQLERYGRFLRDLRARLPAGYRLSITGLLDWSSQANPAELAALRNTIDEIVLQTYQGTRTISSYRAYIASLLRLRIPFKIGLVQGGEWQAPSNLAENPWFRGYVVFLLNPAP
jgi:hypothetical protein